MITTEQSCLISVKEITRIIQNEQTQRPWDAEWAQGRRMGTGMQNDHNKTQNLYKQMQDGY